MMESTNSTTDQQTPPIIPINNSSSRRKQSKPNRLEHTIIDNPSNVVVTCDSLSILPSITQYHVAAEQQDIVNGDDEYDEISLNCEDGSLSSQSTNEHYNINKSKQSQLINNETTNGILDFSLKLNDTNQSRSLNTSNKSRSLKRKHSNTNIDNGETTSISTRIFHADAFCGICKKEFCNKYFLKTHLANKHGIFDHQSVVPSGSNGTISSLLTSSEDINDSNIQHPFTIISTLINNDHEDLSSPSSNINENQINGIIIPSEDDNNNYTEEEDNDDEQDGSSSNLLINLPEQITTILGNDNNSLKTDEDQRVMTTNSPTNNLDFQSSSNLSRQSSTKLLEDFCDICQKHFCNKYYLRKHKLDVHGVQTDCNIKPYKRIDNNSLSSKNSPPLPPPSSSSSLPNVTFNPSSVQQSLGMLLNPIFSPLVQSTNSNEEENLLTNKRRYTDSSNESSSSKSQYISSDISNVFTNQIINNNSKSQISNCNLCGKKFQSNDYLQLHLMNKHQIKTDIQKTTKLSNLIKTSNDLLNNNNNTIKKIKLEPNETTNLIKPSSPINTNTTPIVDTYFAAKMADRVSCDICHKQVCNKYFLKTHKLKVHGVGSDPMITSSNNNNEINEEEEENNNSSPPQLVVDEIINEPGVIPSPDVLTASVNTFIGTNNELNEQLSSIICDLCSKTFPSKFLLHIHITNVHGIQQSNSISNGTTINNNNNQIINSTIKRPSINGNNNVRLKQTPQVQLRVTCQVCKKELCNKYFLRAHMRNVHNISVDDIRLIQPQQSNSTSQLSSDILSPTESNPTDILIDSNESETISSSNNDNNNNNNQLLSMQPFLVESDDDLYKDLFVPCMVYLPCRHRVTKSLQISLRLKPVDNNNTSNTNIHH